MSAEPDKAPAGPELADVACSATCEMDRIATGAACGKPAVAVWVRDEKRTRVCRGCSWTVAVCGGRLDLLSPNGQSAGSAAQTSTNSQDAKS